MLLFGEFGDTAGKILLTTGTLSLFSLLALPAGVLLDQGRHRLLALTTLVLATVAFGLAMGLVWSSWDEDAPEGLWKSLVVSAAFAGASAQWATTTSRLRPTDSRVVRALYAASLALGLALASLIAIAALAEIDASGFYRALGAVAVADVLFVIVQSVARRAGGPPPPSPGAGEVAVLRVTGPPAAVADAIPELERRGLTVERER